MTGKATWFALGLACLIVTGCAAGTTFEHSQLPFKLKVAPGWMTTNQGIGVIITPETEVGPDGRGVTLIPGGNYAKEAMYRLTIFNWDQGDPQDLDEFEQSMDLDGDDSKYGRVTNRFTGRIAGEDCRGYDIDSSGMMTTRIFFHSGKPYFVTMSAPREDWAKTKPIMESMVKTLRWTD